MPFWKKSEDPWDQPVRRPKPRPAPDSGAGTGREENTAQELREMFRELGKIPLCCVLPRTHPYAGWAEIGEEALYDQNLILCNSYTVPSKVTEVQNRVVQHISPERIHASDNPRAVLTLVRAGYGCSILPIPSVHDGTVACVPIKNVPPLSYGMIFQKDSSDPVLKRFLDIALRAPGA